jgi:hypothetical protein
VIHAYQSQFAACVNQDFTLTITKSVPHAQWCLDALLASPNLNVRLAKMDPSSLKIVPAVESVS